MTHAAIADARLLERWISQRDAEALDELVSRHADLVFGVSKRILRNDADAEDVAQSCFLTLAAADSPPRASVAGWLHTVATRRAVDLLRSHERRRRRERAAAEARAQERADAAAAHELMEHVDACIAALPRELRDVIVAHFLERRTHEAIARELGVSRQTVTLRIRKGIERIRRLLAKRGAVVSAAAIAATLGALPIEAAPAALLAGLGRIALSGTTVAAGGAPVSTLPLLIQIGGTLMAKKLIISAAAALLVVLLAGLVLFRGANDRADPLASRTGGVGSAPRRTAVGAGDPATVAGIEDAGRPARAGATGNAGDVGDAQARATTPAGPALAGVVVDGDGRPVAGAAVVAASNSPGGLEGVAEAVSDDDGSFRLELPPEETPLDVAVFAFKTGVGLGAADGAAAATRPGVADGERDLVEIALEPLAEVSGRCHERNTGAGVGGLSIVLLDAGSPDPSATAFYAAALGLVSGGRDGGRATRTDDSGRYVFADVPPGRYRFAFDPRRSEFVLPGYRRHDIVPDLLLAAGERRADVDFALERGGSIAGTVRGPDGRPIAGASLKLVASYYMPRPRSDTSGPDGTFQFSGIAPNATYAVHAVHDGLPPGESEAVVMPIAEAFEGVDVVLSPGHAAVGRFIDGDGMPIGGFEVLVWRRPRSGVGRVFCEKTVVADDGSFTFERVSPGKHVVETSSPAHVADGELSFDMPAGDDLAGLEFVLRRKAAGFIAGTVVDPDGTPVAGMPVMARIGDRTVSETVSAEDGSFRLENLGDVETYVVASFTGEHWSLRQPGVPVYATDVTVVVYERGRIRGRVIDAGGGAPIPRFEMRVMSVRVMPNGGENRYHTRWTTVDSENGEFLHERAEPVECQVQVRAEGYVPSSSPRFPVPPGGTADGIAIALHRGASLSGIAVDAATGEPLPDVRVRAHQTGTFSSRLLDESKFSYSQRVVWKLTMSRLDGTFSLDGIEPGERVQLVAWKEGYGAVVRPRVVVEEEAPPLRIALAPAATLAVSARFRPRPGERVELTALHRAEKPWRAAFWAFATLDAPGLAEIGGLPPGPYRLAVSSVTRGDGSTTRRLLGEVRLEIEPGERRELSIDLDELAGRFASVSGVLTVGADHERVVVDIASVDDPGERYTEGPTPPGTGGRFRFTGIPAGRYVVVARGAAGGETVETRVPVEVGEGEHREIEVALE